MNPLVLKRFIRRQTSRWIPAKRNEKIMINDKINNNDMMMMMMMHGMTMMTTMMKIIMMMMMMMMMMMRML